MKRRFTAYPIVRWLFLVLIIALLPVSVWAQETTLTANVPSVHTLHIELTGNGRIVVDGVPYEKTVSLQIKRHSVPEISVIPDNEWKLKSVFLDGQDITSEFQGGVFDFSEMRDDLKLTVVFEAQSSTPQTGDNSHLQLWWLLLILSATCIVALETYRRKKQFN